MTGSQVPEPKRSVAIDALRGAAIVSMLAANLAGPCLRPPHPLWLRLFGSLAAPAFVLLAGMMVSRSRRRTLPRLLERAAMLLALAVAIDIVCWGVRPFETFDVLYLLALALPVAAGCLRLPARIHWVLALAILGFTPWMQARLGYGPLLPDALAYPWPAWRRFLVDGWFPAFPWLGVALLGAALARAGVPETRRRELVVGGLVLVVSGGMGFWLSPPELTTRGGYSELFYPPTGPFLALALGVVLGLMVAFQALAWPRVLGGLALLGRASLPLYVLHVALIALVLDEWFEHQTLPRFLGLYALLLSFLFGSAWLSQRYRSRLSP